MSVGRLGANCGCGRLELVREERAVVGSGLVVEDEDLSWLCTLPPPSRAVYGFRSRSIGKEVVLISSSSIPDEKDEYGLRSRSPTELDECCIDGGCVEGGGGIVFLVESAIAGSADKAATSRCCC